MSRGEPKHILLSRTDNIGDTVLSLPLAALLKQHVPGVRISWLGKGALQPVASASPWVDAYLAVEDFLQREPSEAYDVIVHIFPNKAVARRAKQLGIAQRIGTNRRLYHWGTCNRLVNLSRRHSALHEAQLNTRLLAPLGYTEMPSLAQLAPLTNLEASEKPELPEAMQGAQKRIILHPKSRGSAREWPLASYRAVASALRAQGWAVGISGTAEEGQAIRAELPELLDENTDLTGHYSLAAFMGVIAQVDGLLACSTGPLHLAAGLGIHALGIYPPIRPMHPGRWAPLGPKAEVLVENKTCGACRKQGPCACIQNIGVQQVLARIAGWETDKPEDA